MKLELGSGYHPTPGFVHLDLNPNAPGIDIVGPAYPLPNLARLQKWDEIRAVDVLEHLSYRDVAAALREWASVLEPGGKLYVQVPAVEIIMGWYAESGALGDGIDGHALLLNRLPPEIEPRTPMMGAAWRLLGGHADADNGRDDWKLNAHYSLFDVNTLAVALADAGFEIEKIEFNDHPNICCWAVKR